MFPLAPRPTAITLILSKDTAFKMNKKQHVGGHQPAQREHLRGEEIGPHQQRQVGPNEVCVPKTQSD